MFEINYRLVYSAHDDFAGQNGFFQIKCNGHNYGEMYPREIEGDMDKVSLYEWFERLVKVIKNLKTKEYIALSDVESYNTWIEFRRRKEDVIISIVKAKKELGSNDIEYVLRNVEAGAWTNQVVSFKQLTKEVIEKGTEYVKYIASFNIENASIRKLKQEFQEIS